MTEPNETVQSQLSAFVDNELPQDETELLARRLSRDTELQQSMSRYLLMGEALRAPSQALVSRDFSMRIAAALEQDVTDDTKQALPSRNRRAWLKPAIGMSLAASVAAIAVMSVHTVQTASELIPAVQMAATNSFNNVQSSSSATNSYVVPVATTAPSAPISAARLTNYVVAHSEFTSPLGRRNMLTELVTEDQQTEETAEESGTK